jgi:hypothetical protein
MVWLLVVYVLKDGGWSDIATLGFVR